MSDQISEITKYICKIKIFYSLFDLFQSTYLFEPCDNRDFLTFPRVLLYFVLAFFIWGNGRALL